MPISEKDGRLLWRQIAGRNVNTLECKISTDVGEGAGEWRGSLWVEEWCGVGLSVCVCVRWDGVVWDGMVWSEVWGVRSLCG